MKSDRYILFLIFLFASTGPVSSTLYLASLPAIIDSLHTTESLTQLTIALFILGYAIARLMYATASDAVGRKSPLIIGLLVCISGSVICLLSTNIVTFSMGRFLQGFGSGGSSVLARVILRDKIEGIKLARYNSYYGMVNTAAMISAPLVGGYLQSYFGWQSNFMALVIYNGFALMLAVFVLPETNLHLDHTSIKPSILKSRIQSLFAKKGFIVYALLLMLGYGAMVAWLTAGPIVLQDILLLTPVEFGWSAAAVGMAFFIGAYINSHLVHRLGVPRMLGLGAGCLLVAGIFMLTPFLFFEHINFVVFLLPIIIANFGISLLMPNAYGAGLRGVSKMAGIAVAVLAFLQVLGGVITGAVISLVHERNQFPLGLTFFIIGLTCTLLVMYLKFIHRKADRADS